MKSANIKSLWVNKLRYFYYLFFLSIYFSSILSSGGEIRDRAISAIESSYDTKIEIITYKLNLNTELKLNAEKYAKQRFFGKFVYYYKIKNDENILGYAILDNTMGKVKPITFLVMFNKDLSIKDVEIIKYREQHGGAVGDPNWLNQFKNKNINSVIELNNNIDGISGATISVKSIINGVKLLLNLINNLGENEKSLLVSVE